MPQPTTQHCFDVMIIGQGLAGSILAYKLIQNQQTVLVIDNQHHASASTAAAGIINPITGHRLNMTTDFEVFYPLAKQFYQQLQSKLKQTLFKPLAQIRLIKSQGQSVYFNKRLQQKEYQDYLQRPTDLKSPVVSQNLFKQHAHGLAQIKHSAVVDTALLLKATQQWLIELHSYAEEKLDYQQLRFSPERVEYRQYRAKKIIFCEGWQATQNPWLKALPFKLSQGEIITLTPQKPQTVLANWGHWLTPSVNNNLARLGSNYDWQNLDLQGSKTNQNKLISSLEQYINNDFEVHSTQIGIRPTTTQRIPFIGKIKTLDNAYCFNGFGSKGCLSIPYYADCLNQHLLNGTPLNPELEQWL